MKTLSMSKYFIVLATILSFSSATAFAFYDPGLQRWINRDPVGENGGINLSAFIGNNPRNTLDPFGLRKQRGMPTINGCGDGSLLGGVVPNNPIGFIFGPACNGHDICYGTCGNSKESCDKEFFNNMLDMCRSFSYLPYLYNSCAALALSYYEAVHLLGSGPFEDAQKDACKNCKKHWRGGSPIGRSPIRF